MAKISPAAALTMDCVTLGDPPLDLTLFIPVDLPEGGQLQVTVGESSLVPPQIKLDIPPGAMVAILRPEDALKVFPKLKGQKLPEGSRAAALPPVQPYGLPLLSPVWIPEGGFLQVRVGPNPATMPVPTSPIEKGTLLAVLPPQPAELFRTHFKLAERQNPYAVLPNGGGQ